MDQAWELEEQFWTAGTTGDVENYYAHVLAADAFVVVPGRVLVREDLMRQWADRRPWSSFELSDRRDALVNGETVVLSYRVRATTADAEGEYVARVSSVYTWVTGWVLAFRQHTPDPDENTAGMTLH
ncbi:nuclear transport factor 2 family protein [Spongisporangium articulatum]|uniref:Nuclear transport factor 2 family protein n=1 Tax=Spongisporangium articulatum TaxID=3362603 RepID=A0ABW8ASB7_9ACTN